ncbi:MAG TPA: alpha/beta hydrolase [Verrucomicrobiae bacterium]
MTESLQVRIHGTPDKPTLVYLPGLHGDWTLVGSFRRALGGRVRFVELTYPRTLTWSLDEYAGVIGDALVRGGITSGWLVAESFGSQVAWALTSGPKFKTEGLILAGGFGRHPAPWGVWLAERLTGKVTPTLLTRLIHLYARVARLRYRHAVEVLDGMKEFCARRTDLDRRAAQHRLKLILRNDPRTYARKTTAPVYALTGLVDPIVPWLPVRRWLKRNCPTLCAERVIWHADHTVLASAPEAAADQVLRWIVSAKTGQQ